MKNPCDGCYYYRSANGNATSLFTCDYILMEDHRRPCPPGNRCAVKRVEKRKTSNGGRRATWDTERGYRMYLSGVKQTDIAKELGTSAANVHYAMVNIWKGKEAQESCQRKNIAIGK